MGWRMGLMTMTGLVILPALAIASWVARARVLRRPSAPVPDVPVPDELARPLPGFLRPQPGPLPFLRLGRDHDGGYVLPLACVESSCGLLSMGINDDWSFEKDCSRRGIGAIDCYDPTVGLAQFAARSLKGCWYASVWLFLSPSLRARARLAPPLGLLLDYLGFFRRKARHHRLWVAAADGPGRISVATAMDTGPLRGLDRLMVKMDIEGAEYEALPALGRDHIARIECLIVEFHDVAVRMPELKAIADQLAPFLSLRHIHANNHGGTKDGWPQVLELTWSRRVPGEAPSVTPTLPLPGLDQPNRPGHPDLALRFDD